MKLELGDCFIQSENFDNIKKIYFIKDESKETYTTICIHLDCKGCVTERTDYKHKFKKQIKKLGLTESKDFFWLKKYKEWVTQLVNISIPEYKAYDFQLCSTPPLNIGRLEIEVPAFEGYYGKINLRDYFMKDCNKEEEE